ncbi:MAG: hypothetical protein LW817_02850 [Candidatus Caenarcaniphilales bacterium]|jgi:hypothetical protein|nr:hypothetical protein [Candidatus Caenarcaniphilales bacterium]
MKEILIYGALVAAIIGASVPVIQGLTNTVTTSGQQVNTTVQTRINTLLSSI